MKTRKTVCCLIAVALLMGPVVCASADDVVEQLQSAVKAMQKTIEELQQKVADLEKQKGVAPAPTASAPTATAPTATATTTGTSEKVTFPPAVKEIVGQPSPITDRRNLNDQQDPAQRPNDLTLDPKYRGFIPVPNTGVLIKFNAKPRVDMTMDTRNSGDQDRFITAKIPVKGQSDYGGPEEFNINARGSQMSLDVRAPEMEGNFRFYYQNDFFGSGSGMQYRLRQLYGQFFNFTAGYTFSVFEDPDAWPDTVDYEGPNSAIFARRAVVRYLWQIDDHWQMNFGVEAPGSEVNSTNSISQVNRAPDSGLNVRWEDAKRGHVQAAVILRDISASGGGMGNQNVFGWGANLSTSLNVFERDSIQGQFTYGEGIFRYFNDDFQNNDAAYDKHGDLEALPAWGALVGYTHVWCSTFRSTGSFGYLNVDNLGSEGPNAYHQTIYGSANIVWQVRKRLSIGLEGLYGEREVQDGHNGNVWRLQLGMVYSLFD